MATTHETIWLKKRVLNKDGVFVSWNIKAVPGDWAIPDNPTTPSKLQLDFLDPRAGWERATPEDISAAQADLAKREEAAREEKVNKRVNEVIAHEAAVTAVMEKVNAKKVAAESPQVKKAKA